MEEDGDDERGGDDEVGSVRSDSSGSRICSDDSTIKKAVKMFEGVSSSKLSPTAKPYIFSGSGVGSPSARYGTSPPPPHVGYDSYHTGHQNFPTTQGYHGQPFSPQAHHQHPSQMVYTGAYRQQPNQYHLPMVYHQAHCQHYPQPMMHPLSSTQHHPTPLLPQPAIYQGPSYSTQNFPSPSRNAVKKGAPTPQHTPTCQQRVRRQKDDTHDSPFAIVQQEMLASTSRGQGKVLDRKQVNKTAAKQAAPSKASLKSHAQCKTAQDPDDSFAVAALTNQGSKYADGDRFVEEDRVV